jgi:hypothetical protein
VDSPSCSTNPPTPGRILHDANLDEAEPCRSEAVSPSAKPSKMPFAAGFTVSHQQCVEVLSRYFPLQGQEPHGRVITFHSRQNFGCRRRTTYALDCSRFPKDPRGHCVSSLVCQTSDSTTLTLPVVPIAERTVMKHNYVLETSSILEDYSVHLGILESRVCSLRVQDGRCHKLARQRRRFSRQVRAELGRRIANGPDDRTIIGH